MACAGLVLEVKPADYDAGALQWPIASGSMAGDYFQAPAWGAVSLATKVHAANGLSYKAVDFTGTASLLGGPLCPASLGGANPKTIEAWCYQPTGANGDAQTILCLGRQGGPDNSNFAFVNSMYNRSIWSPPYIEGWNASNAERSGKWVHLVASYDGSTLNLFVNGAPDKTGIAHTFANEAGGSMTIGMMRYKGDGPNTTPHSTDNADGWNSWRGYLGSIRVYDEARTATQVADDYALGVNYGETGVAQPKIAASAGGNGSISPSGDVFVIPGSNQTFTFTGNLGYGIDEVLVDGANDPAAVTAGSYTFTNVTTDHTIAVSFVELPKQTVSGKVTDGSAGIEGATVYFKTSANAASNPTFTTTTDATGSYSFELPPANWYVTASEIHYFVPPDATFTVASSPVSLPDIVLTANPDWQILFALNTDEFSALADGDRIVTWGGYGAYETYNNGAPMLGPTVEVIDGVKWEKNVYSTYVPGDPPVHARADGFNLGAHASGIPTDGVTIVAVVKPQYVAIGGEPRGEIVDIFYGELFLAVNHGNGEVIVCTRGYSQHNTGYFIPNGQKTILSLVVQPTGEVELFANGVSRWTYSSGADYTHLQWLGGFDRWSVGRNAWDGWSTFNGNIGDVSVYKVALDDATRETVQDNLATKFGIVLHTITATAGPGGSISPAGEVQVVEGFSQAFVISPDYGSAVADVLVDGVSVGAVTSYLFDNVTAPHTIAVTFQQSVLGYEDWTYYYAFLTNPDAERSANPDGDSLPNFAEYALDEDPLSAAASGKMRSVVEDVNGEQALLITFPVLTGATFSGTTSQSASIGGVTYIVEGSNDLASFDQVVTEVVPARSAGLPLLTAEGPAGWTYRTFRLSGPVPARGTAGFLRVRVTNDIP